MSDTVQAYHTSIRLHLCIDYTFSQKRLHTKGLDSTAHECAQTPAPDDHDVAITPVAHDQSTQIAIHNAANLREVR